MYYKLAFKYFFISVISITFLVFAAIWFVDPLQVFHKSIIKPDYYMTYQMREADLGIMNYADFNSAILGTSMVANMSADEATQKLGGKFVNISLFGSTFFERKLVLNKLLKNKKIKKVIMSLDGYFYDPRKNPNQKGGYPLKNFDFLYNDNYLDNFKIYFNSKYVNYLLAPFINLGKKYQFTDNLDRPKAWFAEERYKKRFNGFENWLVDKSTNMVAILNTIEKAYLESLKKPKSKPADYDIEEIKKYIDECILDYVKANPNVEFYMVIPPYSALSKAIRLQVNKFAFDENIEAVSYLVDKAEGLENLKIYGFDNEKFAFNIGNYKDLDHYKETMNSHMIDCILSGDNLLTKYSVDSYYSKMKSDALNYDIKPFYDAIIKERNK